MMVSKRLSLCLLAGAALAASVAMAQEAAPPRGGPLRAPNMPNPPGTDSGAGPPCDQLTSYGMVQPNGPPAAVYGAGAPPAPPPVAHEYGVPHPAPATSSLGAAGAASRGIVVPDAPVLPYRFVPGPQPPRGTIGFANVNGVGLLKNGRLIVNQRMPMFQFLEYTPDNKLVRSIDPNLVSRPHGMRVDKDDNIWVTDQQCNIVVKFNPMGEVLMVLGTNGKAGTWDEARGAHLFNQPTDVGFAPNGDVFVTNGHGGPDPRVLRFDRTGKFITSWSMARPGPAPVVHTIAISPKGEVWVADREVKVIHIFDMDGKPLRTIQMKNLICGFYVDAKGGLWMTTGQDGMVLKLDWTGKVLGYIGKEGFGETDFGEAHYMTMTPDLKTMYVGDTVNNNVKKLELVQ